jgi:hypothetical protein
MKKILFIYKNDLQIDFVEKIFKISKKSFDIIFIDFMNMLNDINNINNINFDNEINNFNDKVINLDGDSLNLISENKLLKNLETKFINKLSEFSPDYIILVDIFDISIFISLIIKNIRKNIIYLGLQNYDDGFYKNNQKKINFLNKNLKKIILNNGNHLIKTHYKDNDKILMKFTHKNLNINDLIEKELFILTLEKKITNENMKFITQSEPITKELCKYKLFYNKIITSSLFPLDEDDVYKYSQVKRAPNYNILYYHKMDINSINNVIELDNNKTYIIFHHIYDMNYSHFLNESLIIAECYMKYFNNKNFHLITTSYDDNDKSFIKTVKDELKNTLGEKILFTNKDKLYHGNFLYLLPITPRDKNIYQNYLFNNRVIINILIDKANKIYKEFDYYEKIYISRRNLKNKHWHNRVMINIDEISDFIVSLGYKEIYTDQIDDFFYQIFLINNCKYFIIEIGSGCDNMIFMKNNSVLNILGNKSNFSWFENVIKHFNSNIKIINNLIGNYDLEKFNKESGINNPYILYKNKLNFD